MLRRCNNPKVADYPNYGGRGIKVCERWLKFENFYADMGDKPDGMSMDRIDPNGDYTPGNVRWASNKLQAWNRRSSIERTGTVVADAISKVAANDNQSYSKDEVLSMLRVLRFNLCG